MYAPHVVTVYNVEQIPSADFSERMVNHVTVLDGVFLDASKGVNVQKSGLEGADAVVLYIPFQVPAIDGFTGQPKQYIGPMEFWALEDKSGYWTLSVNGHGGDTFFVKGAVVEDLPFETISMKYDDVYTMTKIDAKDFGSADMRHWEVGGA